MALLYHQRVSASPLDSARLTALINRYVSNLGQDSATAYGSIQEAMALARQNKETELFIELLNTQAALKLEKRDKVKAKQLIDMTLDLGQSLGVSEKKMATAYLNLGTYHYNLIQLEPALVNYLKAVKMAENEQDTLLLLKAYTNISSIHVKRKSFANAKEYIRQAYGIAEKRESGRTLGRLLGNSGIILEDAGELDSSLAAYRASMRIFEEENLPVYVSLVYCNLANVYEKLGHRDSVGFYYKRKYHLDQSIGYEVGMMIASFALSDISLKVNKVDSALFYLNRIAPLIQGTSLGTYKRRYYELLSGVLEKKGAFQKALEARKKYEEYHDIIMQDERSANIEKLEIKYQSEKKEWEIAKQKTQLAKQQNQLKLTILLAIFTLVSMILIFFLLRQKRENRYQKRSIDAITDAQEKERQRIAQDLHDSVGSLLADLKRRLSLKEHNTEELVLLESLRKEIRQVSYAIMPDSLARFGLEAALKGELDKTARDLSLEAQMTSWGLTYDLSKGTEIHIYRIVQEALQNIRKHAKATRISLSLLQKGNNLNLVIEDNGKGFNKEEANRGLGLKNIISRINLLRGQVTIDSNPKSGTTLNINLPVS